MSNLISKGFIMRVAPLIVLALLSSLYLLHHDLSLSSGYQVGTSFCKINDVFDCDALAKSDYSRAFGLPVAMYGALFYSLLLFLLFCLRGSESRGVGFPGDASSSVLFWSFLSIFPSAYLAYASFFIVKKVCIFCTFLYLANLFLFFLSWYLGRSDGGFFFRLSRGAGILFSHIFFLRGISFPLAVVGFGIFYFFGQVSYIVHVLEPRYLSLYDANAINELSEEWKGSPVIEVIKAAQTISGAVKVGSDDAPFRLVKFSDHECPLCQRTAPIVEEIITELGTSLQVVFLSYPLDISCNPFMDRALHPNACKLASLVICEAFSDQEKAHRLHEAIMAEGITSEEQYQNFIREEGLNEDTCFGREDVRKSLLSQIHAGDMAEITGTPSFFLNGKRLTIKEMRQLKPLVKRIVEDGMKY